MVSYMQIDAYYYEAHSNFSGFRIWHDNDLQKDGS